MKAFPRSDLFQLVVDAGGLSEADARPLFSQMLSCVRSLHDAGICHCDLGIESFTFASGTDKLRLIHMHSSHQYPWDAILGVFYRSSPPPQSRNVNYLYAPPENVCSFEADMWSLGVCLFAMVRNAVPVYDSEATARLSAMLDNKFSHDLVDLVDGLLALEPQHRLTAKGAAEHPWVLGGVCVTAISREMSDASISLDSSQQQRKGFNCILCDASVPLRTRPGRRPRWYDNHFCSQACFDNSLATSASHSRAKADVDDSAEREGCRLVDDGEERGTGRLFTCKACDRFIVRKAGRGRRPNWYLEGYCSQECSSVG
jgi:serine/threonine protein kinase